VTCLS